MKPSRKKKSKKGKKSTFLDDPLESIAVHIGKIFDNATPSDIADVTLLGAVGLLGYMRAYQPAEAVTAMVGFKLATTEGGSPPVSQIIGCGLLGYQFIGLPYYEQQQKVLQEAVEIAEAPLSAKPFYTEWVMANITGSTHLMYCAWVKSFHGLEPEICQIG